MLPRSTGLKATPLCQIDCTDVVNIANAMYPFLGFKQGKGVQHSDFVCRLAFVLLYVLGIVVLAPLSRWNSLHCYADPSKHRCPGLIIWIKFLGVSLC